MIMASEKEVRKAERLFKEDLHKRREALNQVEKDAFHHRIAFVKNLEPAAAETMIGALAVFAVRWDLFLQSCDHDLFAEVVDTKTLYEEGLKDNPYAATPAFLLLAQSVCCVIRETYHHCSKDSCMHFSKNDWGSNRPIMDDLYRILFALGYTETEEEKQWRDGSHPAYMNQKLEDFLPVSA